jgi:predicted permease
MTTTNAPKSRAGERAAQFTHEVGLALRALYRTPAFALSVAVTLTVVIGMSTAVFSVVNAVLLRPLSYPSAERLVWLSTYDDNAREEIVPRFDFRSWRREATRSFERMVAYRSTDLTLGTTNGAVQARVAFVSSDFWSVIGPALMLGRPTMEGESGVVLSHGLFVRQFGSDASIVGRSITVDGQPFTVTGVLSAGFRFELVPPPTRTPEVKDVEAYTALDAAPQDLQRSRGRTVSVVGRLREGASVDQALVEIETVRARIAAASPLRFLDRMPLEVLPLTDKLVGSSRAALWLLFAAVGLVFVIGCVNVANLQIARMRGRRDELLIRFALGAGQLRIVRQLLVESGLLAGVSGIAGVVAASWATHAIVVAFPAAVPRIAETTIDARVLMFALIVVTITTLAFAVIPALAAGRANAAEALGRSRMTPSASALRGRGALVAIEIALAVVLLTGGGLLLRSAARLNEHPAGFHPESIVVMKVPLSGQTYAERSKRNAYISEALARIGGLPGVDAVGVTPNTQIRTGFFARGNERLPPGQLRIPTTLNATSAGYARIMGLTVVSGRWITDSEAGPVVVLNEALARREFGDADPVGKQVVVEGIWLGGRPDYSTVVGVVTDVKDSRLDAPADPQIYVPFGHVPLGQGISLVARATTAPSTIAPAMRKAIAALDPTQSTYDVRTLETALADSIAPRRLITFLLEIFAGAALLLVVVGIHGVMAFFVSQRTREIGVRLAVGATTRDVWLMVTQKGMTVAVAGLMAGIAAAAALTRVMSTLLYQVSPQDPITYGAVAIVVSVLSLVACGGPALRATLIDPIVTLRE